TRMFFYDPVVLTYRGSSPQMAKDSHSFRATPRNCGSRESMVPLAGNLPPSEAPSWRQTGGRRGGRQIVYAAAIDGNTDIFVMDAGGGRPKRLTFEPSIDGAASWSRDGRWIYFTSSRAGGADIWRIPSGGGEAVRITYHGGFRPQESPDRKYLYYV